MRFSVSVRSAYYGGVMRLRRGSAATFTLSVSIQRKEQSNETHEGTDQGKAGRARARTSERLPRGCAPLPPGVGWCYPPTSTLQPPGVFRPRPQGGLPPRRAAHRSGGAYRLRRLARDNLDERAAVLPPCPRFAKVLPTLWRSLAQALHKSCPDFA